MTALAAARSVNTAASSPLPLPELSREAVTSDNALRRRRRPLLAVCSLGGLHIRIAPPERCAAWTGTWSRISFSCETRSGILWLPSDLVNESLSRRFPEIEPERLDPAERGLVLDVVERPLLDAIGQATHTRVSVDEAETRSTIEGPVHLAIEIQLETDGSIFPAVIQADPIERDRLAAALLTRPPEQNPFPGLTTTVAMRCGHTSLMLADFSRLEVGGGLLFDDSTLAFQRIMAVTAERFVQSCSWQTIKPTLEGALLKRPDQLTAYYTIHGPSMSQSDPNDKGLPGGVSDVPIHLIFELGRTEVPLADLESLQTGYVFDIGKPLSQSVDILANGRRIGTGELVRIGDTVGVRIARLLR